MKKTVFVSVVKNHQTHKAVSLLFLLQHEPLLFEI